MDCIDKCSRLKLKYNLGNLRATRTALVDLAHLLEQVSSERLLLSLLGRALERAQFLHNVLGFTKVHLGQRVSHLVPGARKR